MRLAGSASRVWGGVKDHIGRCGKTVLLDKIFKSLGGAQGVVGEVGASSTLYIINKAFDEPREGKG